MPGRLRNLWRNISNSFWFVPSLAVAAALVLSWVLVGVDVRLSSLDHSSVPWLFGGTADAARSVLSTIAGSLITVISIAFSLTVIALQQASSQFSPRVLRRFTGDRVNQAVLGAYVGTFVYALMVLREVRSPAEGAPAFVPALSISVAIALAIVCVGMLILFIHHISQVLQVDLVERQIHDEMIERMDHLYPSMIGQPAPAEDSVGQSQDDHSEEWQVRSTAAGFIRSIDDSTLLNSKLEGLTRVHVRVRVGSFVARDDLLATVAGVPSDDAEATRAIRRAVVIDATRSAEQDLLFDVRQLVDIALRALSPGINDPTTAEHAVYYLGDLLGRLGQRTFPSKVRTAPDGGIRIILTRPDWDDFVAESFDQIRDSARNDVHVIDVLLDVLCRLERTVSAERAPAVRAQLALARAKRDTAR
ncbi:MAG: DUF2254 domain-containing protein [Microbacterium sp.]